MSGEGWRSAPLGRAVLVVLDGGPRPLEAVLTPAELDRLRPVLDATGVAARDGEFSRVRLRDAARDAIGRDPFSQAASDDDEESGPWLPIMMIFFGLVGALSPDRPLWQRIVAGLFLAGGLVDAVQRLRRLRRRRVRRAVR